jgi:hypothetical protein
MTKESIEVYIKYKSVDWDYDGHMCGSLQGHPKGPFI